MTVYKILLFSLAVVALNARQSESLALKVTPQDCACFPTDKDNIRISKLANTYGENERKVIYLFRHLDSQKITIYIPNEEKQLNFPDLTVNSHESYDLHKMEHLYYIFDHPSDMITVEEHLKSINPTSNHHEIPDESTHLTVGNVTLDLTLDPILQPTVYEIKPDSTGLLSGVTERVVIDETSHPSHIDPNTESTKLLSPIYEHVVNSVTLVPEHENGNLQTKPALNETEVDSTGLLNGDPGYVVINIVEHPANSVTLVPEHPSIHPSKPIESEIKPDIISNILVHGEPGYVILPNEKYQPNYVHPNTESNELPLPIHEHVENSVTLVPGHENHHDLQLKPSVNEIIRDLTGHLTLQRKPGYVIIDNGKYPPNYVHPNTEIVVNYPNQPENNNIDIINIVPENGSDQYLVIKPTMNETKVNPSVENQNVHGDDTNEIEIISVLPNEIIHQTSTGKPTVPPSVTTKPKDEDVTLVNSKQTHETGYNFIQKVQELLSEDNDNALLTSVNLKLVNNPVVDRWLIEEINQIIKSGPGTLSLSTINLNEIKRRLVYILAQNGLQFSENGYLIDIHGHILQITNLKLRRLMISDPVAYKKLLGGRNCVPPNEIPYLEAVFVSMVHPSKVLGLIPLKISSLSGCRGGTCPGRPCARKHRPVIAHQRLPTKLNVAPVYNNRLDRRGHYSHYNTVNKQGLLENLNTLLSTRIGDKEDDKTHHGADADDGLGIRIIGGNPATGSGTPVNSRGR